MVKRALLIIGFILGGIGVGGSALLLLTGELSGAVSLLFWLLILLVCLKHMKRIDSKKTPTTHDTK